MNKDVGTPKELNDKVSGADNEIISNIDAISNILNKNFFNNELNDQSSNQNSSINSEKAFGGSKKSNSKKGKFKSKLLNE